MQTALEILGYGPTLHSYELFMHLKDVAMWQEGPEIKFYGSSKLSPPGAGSPFGRAEFDNLTGHFEVISDVPAIIFAKELVDAYPDAKVIIVERDVEAWYKSFNDTIINGTFDPITTFVCALDAPLGSFLALTKTYVRGWFKANTEKEFQKNARDTYIKHYELVRAVVPKDRLLDFKLEDGWAPLCAFLGKDIPDVPFPRANEIRAFKEKLAIMMKQAGKRILRNFVPYIGAAVATMAVLLWYSQCVWS
jgi:hypothetical protein